jgi:hypothetical protein
MQQLCINLSLVLFGCGFGVWLFQCKFQPLFGNLNMAASLSNPMDGELIQP